MPKKLLLTSFLTLMIVFAALAYAQDATPPLAAPREATPVVAQQVEPPAGTVKAIVVKSWGDNPVWADLTTNWSTYGKIRVSIDHTTLIRNDFTYTDLVNSRAKVIILSDVAGGNQQYSSAEFAAIVKYAKKGHPVLGTYAAFYNPNGSVDDRRLAPVFGLKASLSYGFIGITNSFKKDAKGCLLNKIRGSSWQSNGYNQSQLPSSGTWTGNLGKAKAQADSDAFMGVVSLYKATTYTGIYISNMPEYQNVGGPDEQLLYNAITCYVK